MGIASRSSHKRGRGSFLEFQVASSLGVLEPLRDGNREGADSFTRLTTLGQAKGLADKGIFREGG